MLSFHQYLQRPVQIDELAHLADFLNKKGNEFLNDLLNNKVTVNLKVDQAAFVVANVNGEIKYYGREGSKEIDKHRRQGADLYETIIKHLEKQDLQKIPKGVSVFLEFFDDRLPTLIKYTQKPRNGLIISYLKKDGKIVAPDHPLNEKMADLLKVTAPPVLFTGKLNQKQKNKLIEYSSTIPEDLAKKYGGKNFVQFVLSLFTPPKTMKWLMTDRLEGMVFYFGDKKVDMAKINDPSFTEGIKAKQNKDDEYNKKMSELIYKDLEKLGNKVAKKRHSSFVDFCYALTVEFLKNPEFKKLNKYKMQVTENRFARLSFELLPSKIFKLVNKTWYAEDIYRILHFMLRHEKKRANPRTGLTKERKEMVNSIVAQIQGLK